MFALGIPIALSPNAISQEKSSASGSVESFKFAQPLRRWNATSAECAILRLATAIRFLSEPGDMREILCGELSLMNCR
jgi:hypothetical protein